MSTYEMNGSENNLVFYHNNSVFINSLFDGKGILKDDGNGVINVVDSIVESFLPVGDNGILYRDDTLSAFYCNIQTKRRYKLNNDNEVVVKYINRNNSFYLLIEKRNGNRYVSVIDHNLSSSKRMLEDKTFFDMCIYNEYIIYTCRASSGNLNINLLNITTGSTGKLSSKLIENKSCFDLHIYNDKLIFQVSNNNFYRSENSLYCFCFTSGSIYEICKIASSHYCNNINCYRNNIYFTDAETKYMYQVPLAGGAILQITDFECDQINLVDNYIHYLEYSSKFYNKIQIGNVAQKSATKSNVFSQAAIDILSSNTMYKVTYGKDYKRRTIDEVMVDILNEYEFEEQFLRYVVTFISPWKNYKQEDKNTLMKVAQYTETGNSHPILFVDSSTFCTRSKGFIVATDGLYVKGKKYAYRHDFCCDLVGFWGDDIQELSYSLDLPCVMNGTYKSELVDLMNIIFAVCHF